jgi:predicted acyltransferase
MAQTSTATQLAPERTDSPVPGQGRLVSLDAFRGATIALMVVVNTAGDSHNTYAPLRHADWNGWTPTDTVFPSFLWIVGLTLTLSLGKRLNQGIPRVRLFGQVLRRAAIIYALGLFLYGFPHFQLSTWRVLGVLQRIAICYAIAAAIYLTSSIRTQFLWIVGLLASYWALMVLVPVPGYGAGHLDVEGNLAHYVDRLVLGSHNYSQTKTWDPEGIVSTLPAIATALFGVMCGHLLRLTRTLGEKTVRMLLIGCGLIALGLICNIWLPINKKLWTSSFALFMAGLDFVALSVFLWLVDIRGYKAAVKPLVIMGLNPITVYMASELLEPVMEMIRWHSGGESWNLRDWIYQTLFVPLASPMNASLLYALAYMLVMFGIAFVMYRRGWIVRA